MQVQATPKTGCSCAADIDAALPRSYFVKRGDIISAFGLTRNDMEALVPSAFVPSPNPGFKRARFVRSQVMEIARKWEKRAA